MILVELLQSAVNASIHEGTTNRERALLGKVLPKYGIPPLKCVLLSAPCDRCDPLFTIQLYHPLYVMSDGFWDASIVKSIWSLNLRVGLGVSRTGT